MGEEEEVILDAVRALLVAVVYGLPALSLHCLDLSLTLPLPHSLSLLLSLCSS